MSSSGNGPRDLATLINELGSINDPAEAMKQTALIRKSIVQNDAAWQSHGEAMLSSNKQSAAFDMFRRSILLNPQNLRSLLRASGICIAAERWKLALTLYKTIIAIAPDTRGAYGRAGRCQFILGEYEESYKSFQTQLSLAPMDQYRIDLGRRLDSAAAAFIHLPKTGGTSVEIALKGSDIPTLHHRIVGEDGQDANQDYYCATKPSIVAVDRHREIKFFANIRNIFSFLFSHYHWSKSARWEMPAQFENNIKGNQSFEDYVYELGEKGSPWPSRHFINIHLFSQPSGSMVVSWINRMEFLNADMADMADAWGLLGFNIGHENPYTSTDYRASYTDKLIDFVYTTWRADIELFGFEFDGYSERDGLYGDVSSYKDLLRYSSDSKSLQVRESTDGEWADF